MTDEELLAVLGKRCRTERQTDKWLEWAKQVIESAPLDKFRQLNDNGAAVYLCRILYLLVDFDGGFAYEKCVDLESVRLAFCSGLAVCRFSKPANHGFLYQRGLDWCRHSGLMRFETEDRWCPGMRSGSGMTDVVFLTPAGRACAFPEPAAGADPGCAPDVDLQPQARTEGGDAAGGKVSTELAGGTDDIPAASTSTPSGAPPAESAKPEDAWFYLSARYDEATFNHDPATLGRVVGDPNYYPVDSGTLYFFKVQGQFLAQRLVRLFDRGVKPYVEREDETRVRVSFSCQPADSFDEDEAFLIEEEIDAARAAVERLDREWQAAHSPGGPSGGGEGGDASGHRRPLSGDLLSNPRLFDQASRWCERLRATGAVPAASADAGPTPPADEETAIEPASAEVLRVALPTAVIAAAGVRDLMRVRAFYPDVIPEAEAKSLHEQLVEQLRCAAAVCNLGQILEITPLPVADESGSDAGLSAIMGLLALHHPDVQADVSSPDAMEKNLEAVMAKCQQDVQEPVRSIAERIVHAMLYDCRMPAPKGDPSYREPQRYLQMLRAYWGIVRQLVLHHIDAPASYQPHPLLPLVVNLKARIEACLDGLQQHEDVAKIREAALTLMEIVVSGEPDDLQAVPEWSMNQVADIDRFLEEARLRLGAKAYPLTPAEEMCLKHAQKALDGYERRVKIGWAKMLDQVDAERKDRAPPASPPAATTQATPQEPEAPKAFSGGKMVFYPDRVELCGVAIYSGPRNGTRRGILDLLAKKRANGSFVTYCLDELATSVKKNAGTVLGAIRDLRSQIVDALRSQGNILCSRRDVILSGGPGYRFTEKLSVHQAGQPEITDITDTAAETDVPNVRDPDVRDVRNVLDDAAAQRRAWILQRLADGHQLQAPAVARQFKCSVKTAQRDLTALKDEGRIEFVGPPRTGFYRLRGQRDAP